MVYTVQQLSSSQMSSSESHSSVHPIPTNLTKVIISLLFAVVTYWLVNLRSGAVPFVNYLVILYLDLLAAESLVVLISAIFPIFVVSLALTAFANGLWMTVGGFLVTPTVLNVFWKYSFYQFDYQRYAFSALVRNQMVGSVYTCGDGCECMFVTSLANQCMIEGSEAAAKLGYTTNNSLSYVCPNCCVSDYRGY
jgi:hypothetical protein